MVLKKLSVESMCYSIENMNEMKRLLKRNCERSKFVSSDLIENMNNNSILNRREKEFMVRDLVTAISLCHNVMPIVKEG